MIITTMMMAISCTIMANLPTYAQIGIAATWIVTGCRVMQGLSSMGEIVGAWVYISELVKPPAQYPATALVGCSSQLGTVLALGVASLVTHFGFNWRIAFWIGACVAVVGSAARTRLRETPEFLEKIQKIRSKLNQDEREKSGKITKVIKTQRLINKSEKMNRKTYWAYISASFGWPLVFYLTYMYFITPLEVNYGYTAENIILHNFLLSIYSVAFVTFLSLLSFKIHPLKIIKLRGRINILVMLLLPFAILSCTSYIHIFLIQVVLATFAIAIQPADSIFLKYIPTLKRLTTASFVYALTRATVYVITSFSLVYLTEVFGYYGLWIVTIPISVSFLWGVSHFEKLEKIEQEAGAILPLAA